MNLYFSLCENKAEMRFPPWEKDIGSLKQFSGISGDLA